MKSALGATVLLLSGIVSVGCHRGADDAIRVVVLVNVDSVAFTHVSNKLVEFGRRQHWTRSGKRIEAFSMLMTTSQFQKYLAKQTADATGPDIVVLGSSQDMELNPLLKREASRGRNVCGLAATCLAFVPSWIRGQQQDAAQEVLATLTAD